MSSEPVVTINHPVAIDITKFDHIPHQQYCYAMGKGDQYVRSKIKTGKWQEGKEYFYDPDGQLWVNIKEAQKWVTQNYQRALGKPDLESKSDSLGKDKDTNRSGQKRRRKPISKQQVVYEVK